MDDKLTTHASGWKLHSGLASSLPLPSLLTDVCVDWHPPVSLNSTWRWTMKLVSVYDQPRPSDCPSHPSLRRRWPGISGCCCTYLEQSASALHLGMLGLQSSSEDARTSSHCPFHDRHVPAQWLVSFWTPYSFVHRTAAASVSEPEPSDVKQVACRTQSGPSSAVTEIQAVHWIAASDLHGYKPQATPNKLECPRIDHVSTKNSIKRPQRRHLVTRIHGRKRNIFHPVILNFDLRPLTFANDQVRVNLNLQEAKYLGQRSLTSIDIVLTHTHTWPTALPGPLKWSTEQKLNERKSTWTVRILVTSYKR